MSGDAAPAQSSSIAISVSFPDHGGWDWRIGISTDTICVAIDEDEIVSGLTLGHLSGLAEALAGGRTASCDYDNESRCTLSLRMGPLPDGKARIVVRDRCEPESDAALLDIVVPLGPLIEGLRAASRRIR